MNKNGICVVAFLSISSTLFSSDPKKKPIKGPSGLERGSFIRRTDPTSAKRAHETAPPKPKPLVVSGTTAASSAIVQTNPFPHVHHVLGVILKFTTVAQHPNAENPAVLSEENAAIYQIVASARKNLSLLAQTSARASLETYEAMFSPNDLDPSTLASMVKQLNKHSDPIREERAPVLSIDPTVAPAYEILDRLDAQRKRAAAVKKDTAHETAAASGDHK